MVIEITEFIITPILILKSASSEIATGPFVIIRIIRGSKLIQARYIVCSQNKNSVQVNFRLAIFFLRHPQKHIRLHHDSITPLPEQHAEPNLPAWITVLGPCEPR